MRAVSACACNERPEHHQCGFIFGFIGRNHGAVTIQASEVEVSMCRTLAPVANALTGHIGALGRCRERVTTVDLGERAEDVCNAIDLAG